jgi:hypothetical protein
MLGINQSCCAYPASAAALKWTNKHEAITIGFHSFSLSVLSSRGLLGDQMKVIFHEMEWKRGKLFLFRNERDSKVFTPV